MANGNGKNWSDVVKTILSSPTGGWFLCCAAFGFITWWTIQDRKLVYQEVAKLRENAMALIIETHDMAEVVKAAGLENNRLTEENHEMLKEIHAAVRERKE